jgi:hypothetical protein
MFFSQLWFLKLRYRGRYKKSSLYFVIAYKVNSITRYSKRYNDSMVLSQRIKNASKRYCFLLLHLQRQLK